MKILVTGAAGFIGAALSRHLLSQGDEIIGVDNLNDYYEVSLKKARLEQLLLPMKNFKFTKLDIADRQGLNELFKTERPQKVVNLAAQAGVRYSSVNPHIYVDTNLVGFVNILEGCRHNGVEHLVYASTSSVYGLNTNLPFSEHESANHPVSLYGATKRANELLAHSYSSMFKLPTTGLRFFTVYGPWGRPDMALFLFTRNILEDKPIDVFNYGKHWRDFTYVDDIVEGVSRVVKGSPTQPNPKWDGKKPDPATSSAPYRVYNIGNSKSVSLMKYIELLEECLGKQAKKNFLPVQQGDVESTYADVQDLMEAYGAWSRTSVETGVRNFVQWYREYYRV